MKRLGEITHPESMIRGRGEPSETGVLTGVESMRSEILLDRRLNRRVHVDHRQPRRHLIIIEPADLSGRELASFS